MNKFQKVAFQIAKDDLKKTEFENISVKRNSRGWYSYMNNKIGRWSFEKALDFKKWNKTNFVIMEDKK